MIWGGADCVYIREKTDFRTLRLRKTSHVNVLCRKFQEVVSLAASILRRIETHQLPIAKYTVTKLIERQPITAAKFQIPSHFLTHCVYTEGELGKHGTVAVFAANYGQ